MNIWKLVKLIEIINIFRVYLIGTGIFCSEILGNESIGNIATQTYGDVRRAIKQNL